MEQEGGCACAWFEMRMSFDPWSENATGTGLSCCSNGESDKNTKGIACTYASGLIIIIKNIIMKPVRREKRRIIIKPGKKCNQISQY